MLNWIVILRPPQASSLTITTQLEKFAWKLKMILKILIYVTTTIEKFRRTTKYHFLDLWSHKIMKRLLNILTAF